MQYLWKDKNTGISVEISRPLKESDSVPDKDEALAVGMEVEDYAHADWEKLIQAPAFLGPKGKGNW